MARERIVVIGGGFAGLNLVKNLRRKDAEITLIDKQNHHLFQPLLYQVATAALSPANIAMPLREILRNRKNVNVIMGHVVDIDKERGLVILGNGDEIEFDQLILAVGARHSYFGNDQWECHAPGLKTVVDALQIREKVLISFEKAERTDSAKEAYKFLNFVIVGGGPTGVEMAGAIAEIAYKTMFKNFRKIRPEKSRIYLIEGSDRLVPCYPPSLSDRAKRDLERMGVKVITGKNVTEISDEGVNVGEKFIPSQNVIWAAGNQASPLLQKLGVECDRSGRVLVESDLSLKEFPNIYVIGDAAHTKDKEGNPLPAIAPVAIQQGAYIAKVLRKQQEREKRKPFRYFDKGSLATIGKARAVGVVGKLRLKGFIAWLAWGFLHIAYLIGFRNRFSVALDWFFHYISGIRGARLIYRSINQDIIDEQDGKSPRT